MDMTYLMLDPNDITNVVGEITTSQILKDLRMTKSEFNTFLYRNKQYKGCILVEKELEPKYDDVFQEVMFDEKNGVRYYATRKCEIYKISRNGKKKKQSIFRHKTKLCVKVFGKEKNALRIIAKAFIDPNIDTDSKCVICEGSLKLSNIKVLSKKECSRYNGGLIKQQRAIGLYEKGQLVKRFKNARIAGKYLYCSHQTIRDACNGKNKTKMFDVRYI